MSFTSKILLPISLLAVIIAALSVNSLRVFQVFSEDSEEIMQRLVPSVEFLLNMDRDMYQALVAEMDILIETLDPQQLQEHVKEHQNNLDQVQERATKVSALLGASEHRAKLDSFSQFFGLWRSASEKRVAAAIAGESLNLSLRLNAEKEFELARDELDQLVSQLEENIQSLQAEVQAKATAGRTSQIAGLILGLLICAVMAVVGPLVVVRPLTALKARFDDISKGSGDLTTRMPVHSTDEIGKIAGSFNLFMDNLQTIVRDIAAVTVSVNEASASLKVGLNSTEASVKQQYQALDMIVTAVNEMGASAQDVARSTQDAATEAKRADHSSQAGTKLLSDTAQAIRGLATNVEGAAEAVSQFERETAHIVTILGQIQAVAAQTNLLALNAAIEAARAGEQGRGFAVVADEVRALANKTQEATGNISDLIDRLQQGVQETVGAMTASTGDAHSSVDSASRATDAFVQIAEAVERISEMSTQIASSAEQQSAVVEDINLNILEVNKLSERSAQNAGHALQDVEQLSGLAGRLDSIVKRFKVD